ncbi:MAG: hypothetical protein KME45_19515 [Stenomitos rutilans HA7619-LM2]|jgi:hypothetical protein|nr:hypothetical protein [Stenomitos rutilans HA7619-LM2]
MQFVKAQLVSTDGGGTIEFMFNPSQLAFKQRFTLNANGGSRTEDGMPKTSFGHPEPCSLSISDIMLDTYEEGGSKSVMTYVKEFEKAVTFAKSGDAKGKRPPTYVFTWGKQKYIRCFVTELSYTLTMFLADGTPVRAKLSLQLEEVDESVSQPGMGASSSVDREGDSRSSRKK